MADLANQEIQDLETQKKALEQTIASMTQC
jgi:hypothetical protein